ncbi:MAG: biosynthetic-type acetolactate synthase large subunit [Syntrophaceae bacterium]|nr:biosynthetic-type acetolactate synthase large subunit [Syntrophaceae bacterium]
MELNGSQVLLRALMNEGVDTIFGYPGGSILDIHDELFKSSHILAGHEQEASRAAVGYPGGSILEIHDEQFKSPFNHILVRHEQGAAHAADGYARSSGKVGVCLVTSGPGATNTVTGIATAYMDSIPMVIVTGQVPTPFIGTDAFQEVDITGITRPCTKHNFLVRHIDELANTVREAFYIARSGRPGPVLIDLPKDVMRATTEYREPVSPSQGSAEPVYLPDAGPLTETVDLIKKAKKPVLLIGGGVIHGRATAELIEFARKVNIPVTSTLMGLGGFPGTDPLWLGMLGMHGTYYANMAISDCDLLITVGVRFSDRVTGRLATFASNATIVQIDIDATSINKNVLVHIPIVSDCRSALIQLNALLDRNGLEKIREGREDWITRIGRWRTEGPMSYCQGDTIKPQCVIETLYRMTKGDAIVATEVGQNQMWTAQFFRFDKPNTFLTSGGLGTMGYGFPAAIGAQVAFPDRLVVDIAGDGSIQMNIQELATAVNYKLPVKVVILNNGYLGMVRQWQELFYEKRYANTCIGGQCPDFVKLAESYGAVGLRAVKPEEVEPTIAKGLEAPGPVLMDFVVEAEEGVYPMVNPGASLTDMKLSSGIGM